MNKKLILGSGLAVATLTTGVVIALPEDKPAKPVAVTSPSASPTTSPTPTPSPTPTEEPEHELGTTIRYTDPEAVLDVTVFRYKRVKHSYDTDIEGAVEVKTCNKFTQKVGISSAPFTLMYDDGTETGMQISGGAGEYPSMLTGGRYLKPGKCVRGWIRFDLVDGKNPNTVEYAPQDGKYSFVWRIK